MVVAPSTNALRRQQPALSEREELAKRTGGAQEGRAPGGGFVPWAVCTGITSPCHSIPRPKCTADSWSCFLLLRVRHKSTQRRLQALGQVSAFHRQAGMLEDCQGVATLLLNRRMGALPGHRHTEAITRAPAL